MKKWSKYNYLYKSGRYGYFLYNSQTNAFIKLDEEIYLAIDKYKLNYENCRQNLDEDIFDALGKAKVFVTEHEEKEIAIHKRFLKYKNSFYNNSLDLVIAPTTGCNFACPYCYEAGIASITMSEQVEQGIINYIQEFDVKSLKYTWYGGEPLLNFSSIKHIVDESIALNKFENVENVVITNGYLINDEFINYFKDKSLSMVQITIDGLKTTHDKYRLHKAGTSTYDTILKNIDNLLDRLTNTLILVRVNITNENKDDFPILWRELNDRWKGKNYGISPSYVDDHGECKIELCSNNDKAQFFIDLYRKHNIPVDFYPSYKVGGCTADGINNFIIDPAGDLYKCWVDIGRKDRVIGSVFSNKLSNQSLFAKYMIGCDMYTDPKCNDCLLFPVCDGGCSYFRLEGIENQTPYNVCPIAVDKLHLYLDNKYEQTLKKHEI